MQTSFRSAVVTSRIAAVAVALLTTWAIVNLVYALEGPALHLLILIGTAIAILDIPARSSPSEIRMVLLQSSQSLLSALTEFGIEHFGAHDLRRTCAKLCPKNGGDLEQIKFLLGHSSIQTTEQYLGSEQDIEVAVNDNLGL
jgi:integrase